MVIQYFGKSFVKISQGDLTLAFNPPSKNSDVKGPKFGADIVLVSIDHPSYNGTELVSFGERKPFVVDGPGEYEIKGVYVKGLASSGADEQANTIYSVVLDDINVCHLGALSSSDLTPEVKEKLGEIDVLLVPTYAEEVIGPARAHKLATGLGPKIIVPLFYGSNKNDTLKKFIKESGEKSNGTEEKLVIKKKDLADKESKLVVVKSF